MGTRYSTTDERRRQLVRDFTDNGHPVLNGIDFVEVAETQEQLIVRFVHPLPGEENGVPASSPALSAANVRITGGARVRNVRVTEVVSAGRDLSVTVSQPGDFAPYRLSLSSADGSGLLPGFDPRLAAVEFSFKVGCPSDLDCGRAHRATPAAFPAGPAIDYLSKDYEGFRRLMLDRLRTLLPNWHDQSPADLGVALVEVLAYAADHLSYFQDAVATEAYLGTARKRVSLRRHARLLDYAVHEGCNARAWVHLAVNGEVELPKGTQLLTRVPGLPVCIAPASPDWDRARAAHPVVFETLHDVTLYPAHNQIAIYTWGNSQICLPQGATSATLRDDSETPLQLQVGDVLVFQQVRSAESGRRIDADPNLRHAVRLSAVAPPNAPKFDPLFDDPHHPPDANRRLPVCHVEWAQADALPFALCLRDVLPRDEPDGGRKPVTVAFGNVVLADHGRTVEAHEEEGQAEGLVAPATGRFRPRLVWPGVTHHTAYDHRTEAGRPATLALAQDPQAALAHVRLHDGAFEWRARRDLLRSGRFDRAFAVEVDEEGYAHLRFGDGLLGMAPAAGTRLLPRYRVGSGTAGNVGADVIAHVVTATPHEIEEVRNPLPASGGRAPQPMAEVRLNAPQAFRVQERAVTEDDYAAMAGRHPDVQKAVATRRWTGSWHTMFLTVDRKGGRPVDAAFERELCAFLERYRLAGHDIEIEPPRMLPLDIALDVCVQAGYARAAVRAALNEVFGAHELPDGRQGFFHPDRFTFGQPLYLSQVLSAAHSVPGVRWVTATRFQRLGAPARGELAEGRIAVGRLEVAYLANDPNAPENGIIEFQMEGGL
jgi:hypothetical protein